MFSKHKGCRYGVRNLCKNCQREQSNSWRAKNKERISRVNAEYFKNNQEKVLEANRSWYRANNESVLARTKKYKEDNAEFYKQYYLQYGKDNKEKIKQKSKQHYENNKEKITQKNKKWKKENREKYREYIRKNQRERRLNPANRVNAAVSVGIYHSLKKNKKGRGWESLVGYKLADLMSHLESQFSPGMTWDNYGFWGWHIDHIRPISSFNIKSNSCSEFKKCWALENLQPLWRRENISKGNRIISTI